MPAVADLLPLGCELPLIGVRTTQWTYSFGTRGMAINDRHVYISGIGHGEPELAVSRKWELTIRLSGSTRRFDCSTLVTGFSCEPHLLVPLVATRLLIAACWVASDQLVANEDMAQHRTLGNRFRDLEGAHGLDGSVRINAREGEAAKRSGPAVVYGAPAAEAAGARGVGRRGPHHPTAA